MRYILALATILLTYIYFALFFSISLNYIYLPVSFVLAVYFLLGFNKATLVALISSFMTDIHYYYIGQYMLPLMLALIVSHLIYNYMISGQTIKSEIVLYFFALLFFNLGLIVSSSLEIGSTYYNVFDAYIFIRLISSTIILTLITFIIRVIIKFILSFNGFQKKSF